MDHLEYCVQVWIGGDWQPVTEYGKPMVFDNPSIAADLCTSMNEQCGKYKHRVALRTVSPWCEMKRKEVR